MPSIDINNTQVTPKSNYSESTFYETTHFKCITGWLAKWGINVTPDYYIKSKLNNNIIKTFGSQSMSYNDQESTKREIIKHCNSLESTFF